MAKKQYSKEEIENIVQEFEDKEKFTLWQFDSMDSYVAITHPNDLDNWLDKCFKIPKITQRNEKEKSDIKSVRKLFLETYFPTHTEEAIKARKAEEKARKESEKAQREAEKNLSAKEKRMLELKRRYNIE